MLRRRSNAIVSGGAGLTVLLVTSLAGAQSVGEMGAESSESEPAPLDGQRNVGVLLTLGSYTGFGAGVQAGSPEFGVRAAAGWVPVLISVQQDQQQDPELKFYSGLQLAGDAYARAVETRRGGSIGVTSGYRYHSLLGSGVALGGYGVFRVNKTIDGFVQGGLVWFFSGEEQLRERRRMTSLKRSSSDGRGPPSTI